MNVDDVARLKAAVTDHDIHDVLRQRWSPRAFDGRPVERATILRLVEAARWAPSCFNEQPCHFVLSTREQPEGFGRLLDCLTESNRIWARHAAVVGLTVAKLHFERTGQPNRYALHDVGLATANLVFQAATLGVVVHQMAGFDAALARMALSIPAGFEPVTALAFGYPGDPDTLDEPMRSREIALRVRVPLAALAFQGRWGEPL